jgi:two-component system probable response regulator PhcQ
MQRILLLDDEEHVLSALRRVLRSGFGSTLQVEAVSDPELALARLKEVPFDVVVSDYRMPLMTGSEFLGLVRYIQPHAVRMVLSASSDFDSLMQVVNDVEIFRYLTKPWVEKDVIGHVRQALDRADQQRYERELADVGRNQFGELGSMEVEARRLDAMELRITTVARGLQGEVLEP